MCVEGRSTAARSMLHHGTEDSSQIGPVMGKAFPRHDIIFCHLLHIHSGKTGILFSSLLCSLWWVQVVGCCLACRSYSCVCIYIISLSSLWKLIWRHWTYKMPVRYILSSVWVTLSIFSQLSIVQYLGLWFQFTHLPCDDWENIYFVLLSSSNRKYELLPIVLGYVMKQWCALYVSLYS